MRERRVKIETYDWLLYQARERLAAWEERIRASTPSVFAATMDSLSISPGPEEPARKAVREVFGEIYDVSVVSTVRDLDWMASSISFCAMLH